MASVPRGLWWLRVVMLALMGIVAIVLIVDGAVVIGALVGALAATRATMFAVWWRGRRLEDGSRPSR